MNTIIKLDMRGRVVIPTEYREILDLKEGDEVLLGLDRKTDTLTINPIYGDTRNLVNMSLEFGDTPGCLARIAQKVADLKIDMIMTESKSSQRGKKARWDIIADISKSKKSLNELKQLLLQTGFIETMSIEKIARGRLHH